MKLRIIFGTGSNKSLNKQSRFLRLRRVITLLCHTDKNDVIAIQTIWKQFHVGGMMINVWTVISNLISSNQHQVGLVYWQENCQPTDLLPVQFTRHISSVNFHTWSILHLLIEIHEFEQSTCIFKTWAEYYHVKCTFAEGKTMDEYDISE